MILKRFNVEIIVEDESKIDGLIAKGWEVLEEDKPKKSKKKKNEGAE